MLSALISSAHGYAAMPLTRQLPHQKCVIPGPLVLRNEPLKSPAPTVDKDRTVSRRSEPSSRTALTCEQPDPWYLLQPQDAMSRHRVAKPDPRCERLAPLSLLSLPYLFSVPRCQFQLTVKVHRVFPPYCGQATYSPPLQFRRDPLRDSRSVVTRFVQVGTYPTRNFATLGPL